MGIIRVDGPITRATPILLGVGILWYWTGFVGDFEAVEGVVPRSEPAAASEECGSAIGSGDNIDCTASTWSDGCRTEDRPDGRWVEIVSDDEACWLRYDQVRYQRGIVMSLVDRVVGLSTTAEENEEVWQKQVGALSQDVAKLRKGERWDELARLSAQAGAAEAAPAGVRSALEEGRSRTRYGAILHELAAPDTARTWRAVELVAEAAALSHPATKPELEQLRKKVHNANYDRSLGRLLLEVEATAGAGRAFDWAGEIDRLGRLPGIQDKSGLAAVLAPTLERLRKLARKQPSVVLAVLRTLQSNEELLRALESSGNRAVLKQMAKLEARAEKYRE